MFKSKEKLKRQNPEAITPNRNSTKRTQKTLKKFTREFKKIP
jgi:hypothetical protein